MLIKMLKRSLFFMAILSIGIWSCQKEINEFPGGSGNNADLATKINSSASGFVTDENNQPVSGASVTMGGQTTTTDEYGFFVIRNVQVIKNAAVVTVKKSGYFPGIKTYIATAGKSAFFRIQLIPKTTQGTFSAASGGNVTLSNGLSVSFPANAVVNAATGTAYGGTVSVAISWINPTASNIYSIMPGDLRGIDESGALQILQSFGMAAVELTGSNGELLQIASGKKATLSFPIPASISASAPASIPLWYFDETLGLWKEEGSATKNGNTYVGEVSHFSFWNCDVPSNYVQFDCTVVDGDGAPVAYAWVKISVVGNPNNAGYGITDSSGYVGGAVPNNSTLLIEVFNDMSCSTPVYTQTFNTGTTNVSLGTIIIPLTSINIAGVNGTVTDCSNAPVTDGYLIMLKNGSYYRYALSGTGAFDFSTIICNGSENVTLIAEDRLALQQSSPTSATLVNGNNNIGNLQACGVTTQQFIDYTINGVNYSMTYPADSVFSFSNQQMNPSRIEIHGTSYNTGGGTTTTRYLSFYFTEAGTAAGSTQSLLGLYSSDISDSTSITTTIPVNITEYGIVGEYIAGNFSGTLTGAAPANTPYVITGSFRVRRRQ
jgi:hypothetical protein